MTPPRIVRESFEVSDTEYFRLGTHAKKAMAVREGATRQRALTVAAQHGWEPEEIRGCWDLAVLCGLTEYPIYLLGPGAPRIETPADVFAHYPRARYTVTVWCREDTISS